MTQERKTKLMTYKAVASVLKRWLAEGLISSADYIKIEEIIAVKYSVALCSIWRELP